jgi:hypothetical protein
LKLTTPTVVRLTAAFRDGESFEAAGTEQSTLNLPKTGSWVVGERVSSCEAIALGDVSSIDRGPGHLWRDPERSQAGLP